MSIRNTSFQLQSSFFQTIFSCFLIICFTSVSQSKSVDFKALNSPEWLRKFNKPKSDIVIHYYWATWCAPCYHSTDLFKRMAIKYSKDITILAYSDENRFLIEDHLRKTNWEDLDNFQYAVYKKDKEQIEIPFLPYAFVFFEDKLIWSGNPGYMIGELESLLEGVAKSQVSIEDLIRKKDFLDAGLKEVRHHRRKLEINTEARIKLLEDYYKVAKENFIAYPKSYDQISDYIDAVHELLVNLEKNKTDKIKERILDLQVEIQDLSKQAAIAFNGKKDELTYIARDLIKFTKIMPLDLRDLIKLSEKSIGAQGPSQYPDYIYYIYSDLLFLQGRISDSRKALDKALQIVDNKKYKEAFLSMYLDHDNRLKAYEKEVCTGFISCIKKAVGF